MLKCGARKGWFQTCFCSRMDCVWRPLIFSLDAHKLRCGKTRLDCCTAS